MLHITELFNILQSSNIRDASFDDAREALLQQSTLLMEEEEERWFRHIKKKMNKLKWFAFGFFAYVFVCFRGRVPVTDFCAFVIDF